jgi:hypothetical protein
MDPATIATLGAPLLQEAIKSVVSLAGDALRRWRERRETRSAGPRGAAGEEALSGAPGMPEVVPAAIEMPDILEGKLERIEYHLDRVERLEDDLKDLRRRLADHADGVEPVDPENADVVEATEALRRVLEAVIGQRITFKGEDRPPSGPIVEGTVDVEEVQGDVAAVRARLISSGRVKGEARATKVEAGGKLTGVEVDRIG